MWAFNGSVFVATGNTSFLDNSSQTYGGELRLEYYYGVLFDGGGRGSGSGHLDDRVTSSC